MSGCVVEDRQSLRFPLEKVMIPYSEASQAQDGKQGESSPPKTDVTVLPGDGFSQSIQSVIPLAWSQSDFPDLGSKSPSKHPVQVKIAPWPSLSTANSPKRWPIIPNPSMSTQDDTNRIAPGPVLANLPNKPPLPEAFKPAPAIQAAHLREVTVPNPRHEFTKPGALRLSIGTKVRKPATLIEDKPELKVVSSSLSEPLAIAMSHQKERSTTPLSTASSSQQSFPSESSRNFLSQSPPPRHVTPPSSSASPPPPLRRASRPGSPEIIPAIKRPKYTPGTRETLASVLLPGSQSLDSTFTPPLTSDKDLRGTEKELQNPLVLLDAISQPSTTASALAAAQPSEPIGLASLGRPNCAPNILHRPKPPVPPKPKELSGHAVVKFKSLASGPSVSTETSKPPQVKMEPESPPNLPTNVVECQTLIDFGSVEEAFRPSSPVLHSDLSGLQIGNQIEVLPRDNVTKTQPDLVLDPNLHLKALSSEDTPVSLVDEEVIPEVPDIPESTVDTISDAKPLSQDQLLGGSDPPQGNASPSPEQPSIEEDGHIPLVYIVDGVPVIPCVEVLMSASPGKDPVVTTNQSTGNAELHKTPLFIKDAAMKFLHWSINNQPETAQSVEQDLFVDCHESQASLSESEDREFHETMNQRSSRPAELNQENKSPSILEMKRRHEAKKNDVWGMSTFQRARGQKNIAKAILSTSDTMPTDLSRHSSKSKAKRPKSKDRQKTVFHLLEPILNSARGFPDRLALEIQIGLVLIPPTQPVGPLNIADFRGYFHPATGLPPPKTVFNNRLDMSEKDIHNLVRLRADDRDIFDVKSFNDSLDFEFHCSLGRGDPKDSFIVTIFNDEHTRTSKSEVLLGNIHLNFPDHAWDAAIVLNGQPGHVKNPAQVEQGIRFMTRSFRKYLSDAGVRIEAIIPRPPFKIEKVIMKQISRYRYLREGNKDTKEDLYLKTTDIQELLVTISGHEDTVLKAASPLSSANLDQPQHWREVSLVSSATEEALESNWKLELGSQTHRWNTATLFGQGMAPVSSSAASSPDSLIDAPGLWSLFGLAEMVVKNMDEIGSRRKSKTLDVENSKALVLSRPSLSGPAPVSSRANPNRSVIPTMSNFKPQVRYPGGKGQSERYW